MNTNINGILSLSRYDTQEGRAAKKSFFYWQVENLIKAGYPKALGKSREKFLKMIMPLERGIYIKGNIEDSEIIPFIIVPSKILLPSFNRLGMVKFKNNLGIPYLTKKNSFLRKIWIFFTTFKWKNFSLINPDTIGTFTNYYFDIIPKFYLIYKVKVNFGELLSLNKCRIKFNKNKKFGLNIDEGIALATQFPSALKDKLKLIGSYYMPKWNLIPYLWTFNGGPELNWVENQKNGFYPFREMEIFSMINK